MAFDDEPLGMAPPMSQSTAYLGVILAVIAETIFLFAWLSDQKNSELKKWAVLLWPCSWSCWPMRYGPAVRVVAANTSAGRSSGKPANCTTVKKKSKRSIPPRIHST